MKVKVKVNELISCKEGDEPYFYDCAIDIPGFDYKGAGPVSD